MRGQTKDCIGFVLHSADLYNHYKNVLRHLEKERFELVLTPQIGKDESPLVEQLDAEGYNHVHLPEVLGGGYRYRILVTNHIVSGGWVGPYLPERLGVFNVRFMYALGKARHNFSSWNLIYDMILCHGPYQVDRLAFCKHALRIQMGYPRYDDFFHTRFDKREYVARLGGDPDRPTALWVPTWRELCSIDAFAERISRLRHQFNVLVKPHPLTLAQEQWRVAILEKTRLQLIRDTLIDITNLYAIADFVIGDYGGPLFSAIYLDRPLLLLNTPNAAADALTGADSPDVVLRRQVPNVNHDEANSIPAILQDEALWKQQVECRAMIRRKYFAPYYGYSAKIAAAILDNAGELLAGRKSSSRVRRALAARIRALATREVSPATLSTELASRFRGLFV